MLHSPASTPKLAPSNDEKLLAALSHASILLPQAGLIVPFVIWLSQRERAPFAAFQARQALIFHLLVAAATWIYVAFGFVAAILTLGFSLVVMIPLGGLLLVLTMLYGIIGALQSWAGRDFRYWLIGQWLPPD